MSLYSHFWLIKPFRLDYNRKYAMILVLLSCQWIINFSTFTTLKLKQNIWLSFINTGSFVLLIYYLWQMSVSQKYNQSNILCWINLANFSKSACMKQKITRFVLFEEQHLYTIWLPCGENSCSSGWEAGLKRTNNPKMGELLFDFKNFLL